MILPHPLPYQGSKRKLAPLIGKFIKRKIDSWYEPFAGSIAMTIWAASNGIAKNYIIGDILPPINQLWQEIINNPKFVANRYRDIWNGQLPGNENYYYLIRNRYNEQKDPVDLLYLICRCVKNSIRFNRNGDFTQSVDKRRMGMRPEKMKLAIYTVSSILKGKSEVRSGDWRNTISDALETDFVYLDPPYLGTSVGRDKRYIHQLDNCTLISGLSELIERNIPFLLSYDGMTGSREYGPPLPEELGMTRLLLHAGVSTQSTLNGKREETIESLYVWPALINFDKSVIYPIDDKQLSFAF